MWEITPNPYNDDFDVMVCDDDQEALRALEAAVEQAWDTCEDGMTRTVSIKRNAQRTGADTP